MEKREKMAKTFFEIAKEVENDPEVAKRAEEDERKISRLTQKDREIVFTI